MLLALILRHRVVRPIPSISAILVRLPWQAEAARKIAWGKGLNGGQTCVAPDYVLVHAAIHDGLVAELKRAFEAFYGADPQARKGSPDFPRIINDRHHARLASLLRGSGGLVIFGGELDAETRYLAPTLVFGGASALGFFLAQRKATP